MRYGICGEGLTCSNCNRCQVSIFWTIFDRLCWAFFYLGLLNENLSMLWWFQMHSLLKWIDENWLTMDPGHRQFIPYVWVNFFLLPRNLLNFACNIFICLLMTGKFFLSILLTFCIKSHNFMCIISNSKCHLCLSFMNMTSQTGPCIAWEKFNTGIVYINLTLYISNPPYDWFSKAKKWNFNPIGISILN